MLLPFAIAFARRLRWTACPGGPAPAADGRGAGGGSVAARRGSPGCSPISWRRIRAAVSIDDISIDVYDRRTRRGAPKVARLQLRRTGAPQPGGPDAWMVTTRSRDTAAEQQAAPPGPIIELEAGISPPDPDTPDPSRDPP